MLQALRSTALFTCPRHARTMALGSSSSRKSIDEALDALSPSLQPTVAKPAQTPVTPSSTFVDVPPSEDPLLHFLTTSIMKHGNRARAAKITSKMLLHIHTLTRAPPMPIVREAIALASPAVKTTSATVRGKIVPRPKALSERQRTRIGIQWILEECDNVPSRSLSERLAKELIAVLERKSKVLGKKEQLHRFAMVNRGVLTTRT